MKKNSKIRRHKEYEECYKKGHKIVTNYFIFFVRQREPDNLGPRLGITVTKKIGNAVVRNRIKRLIREGFRMFSPAIKERDVDIVVVAKKHIEVNQLSLKRVMQELDRACFTTRDITQKKRNP